MEPHEPTPSEIRTRSLREHQRLREAASRLVERARACDCSELRPPLAQAIATLLDELGAHLEREDAALGPVLAEIDPGGRSAWYVCVSTGGSSSEGLPR